MSGSTGGAGLGLEPARIDWSGPVPRARVYGDVYFSADGGLAESRHVFIAGNDLVDRWRHWSYRRPFVIGETGFGTGRNVLLAWQAFLRLAPEAARLHIVSIERHPVGAADLAAFWAGDAELARAGSRLASLLPAPLRGTHRLRLDARVTLDLVFEDAATALAELDGAVDAWFLDGFAPARNPAMWSASLFRHLAAASRASATFATYTCARRVRDNAAAAGFVCEKRAGAGRKREMLTGRLPSSASRPIVSAARRHRPWFEPLPASAPDSIAIIGAGIAGASLAEALARRGLASMVYDPAGAAGGASGNAQAALHIRPAADGGARTRFYLTALDYTCRWLAEIDPERRLWSDCGLLQLACDDDEHARQQRCLDRLRLPETLVRPVDAGTAAGLAGTPLAAAVRGGLFYPNAGWVRPDRLCRQLIAGSGTLLRRTAVETIEPGDTGWHLRLGDGAWADHAYVVLACAVGAAPLCADLPPLDAVRGQVSGFAVEGAVPQCVVCGRGYVMPPLGGRLRVGASFVRDAAAAPARAVEDEANRAKLTEIAPALAGALGEPVTARAALRCSAHDRMPCVGPIPDMDAWRRDYAALALDANRMPVVPGATRRGLWASLAHGAHGLVAAPLAAEMLASRICGEPMPGTTTAVDALHPGRWLIRELVRGR